MSGVSSDGESAGGHPALAGSPSEFVRAYDPELDKLNLKLWEKIDDKSPADISETDVLSFLSGVFSSDFEVRTSALSRLSRLGSVAAQRLVDILVKNPTDSTLLFQVTYVLEEIGKRAVPSLIEALKKVNEFKRPTDLTLLENITETLIRLNDKNAVPILISYINNIKEIIHKTQSHNNVSNGSTEPLRDPVKDNTHKKLAEIYQTARLRIHDLLGEMGTREGLDDLLSLLDDGTKRVHEDVIETLGKIGDHRALIPLLRLYPVELTISELGARFIKLTFREIVRREKISRQNSIFKNLSREEKETLDKIFPRLRNHG